MGSGTAQVVTLDSSDNTLAGLESAINTANIGVTASIVTNSDGSSSLSLLSNTASTAGTLTVTSSIVDTGNALGYSSTVAGTDAQLTVDGVNLTSASNTVANLIPGVTFQLLAPSATESGGGLEQIQVVIGNDNTGVESTVNQFVNDYNSLISAVNTQEGNNSSGTPEPLFGSPTLSLLQQAASGRSECAEPERLPDLDSNQPQHHSIGDDLDSGGQRHAADGHSRFDGQHARRPRRAPSTRPTSGLRPMCRRATAKRAWR